MILYSSVLLRNPDVKQPKQDLPISMFLQTSLVLMFPAELFIILKYLCVLNTQWSAQWSSDSYLITTFHDLHGICSKLCNTLVFLLTIFDGLACSAQVILTLCFGKEILNLHAADQVSSDILDY